MNKKILQHFVLWILVFLGLVAAVVVIFDPFYHYHDAIRPLKRVLEEKEYQVAGTLDHFDYDAVLLGTSVAENNNNAWFDEAFDCTIVKAIRASGSNADLVYFLNRAFEHQPVTKVFYSLGLEVLNRDTATTFQGEDYYYLMNKNPLDDIKYLFNKDVLFKKIPVQIAYSLSPDYDQGESYNWYRTKTFSAEEVLSRYSPLTDVAPELSAEADDELIVENLELLEEVIQAHPETEFHLFIPPNCILWWDNEYRMGELEQELHKVELITHRLSGYENVTLYGFHTLQDIVCDLDLYMDTVHFSPKVNKLLVDKMAAGEDLLTPENLPEYTEKMRDMVINFSKNL